MSRQTRYSLLFPSDYEMSLSVTPFPPTGLDETHLLLKRLLIHINTLKPIQVSLFWVEPRGKSLVEGITIVASSKPN